MEKEKVTEYRHGLIIKDIKDNLEMIKRMVKEFYIYLMVINFKAISLINKQMGLVNFMLQMGLFTKEIGKMIYR